MITEDSSEDSSSSANISGEEKKSESVNLTSMMNEKDDEPGECVKEELKIHLSENLIMESDNSQKEPGQGTNIETGNTTTN